MNGISVIIPTFNNIDFLDQVINSIIKSFESNKYTEYEILLGIDNCKKTLEFLKDKKEYNKINIYYFTENNGPYVVKNSLVNEAKYDSVIFFDSDDIMCDTFIKETILNAHFPHIKYGFVNFSTQRELEKNINAIQIAEGVLFIEKELFLKVNGYYPWKCAADTEFHMRLNYNNVRTQKINKQCFFRRMHQNNLTRKQDTNFQSPIRKEYAKLIEIYKRSSCPNPSKLHTAKFLKFKI